MRALNWIAGVQFKDEMPSSHSLNQQQRVKTRQVKVDGIAGLNCIQDPNENIKRSQAKARDPRLSNSNWPLGLKVA